MKRNDFLLHDNGTQAPPPRNHERVETRSRVSSFDGAILDGTNCTNWQSEELDIADHFAGGRRTTMALRL